MKDVVWSGRGASNTLAVQKSIEEANRLKIPVKSKHLERLEKFRTQVLNLEYPTCPLSWERHTESVQSVEDEYGVVWRDQDGYYCAPPGLSPDTLVSDEQKKYKSPHELKKEIEELTGTIQRTLDPDARAKYEQEEDEKDRVMAEISSRRLSASREHLAQKKKEAAKRKAKADETHVKTLSKIYRESGHKNEEAEEKAKSLLASAYTCVSGRGGEGCTPYEVTDKNVVGGKRTVYIPTEVMSSEEDEDLAWKQRLQAWWRAFKKVDDAKKELEKRKNDARYL